MKRLPLLALLAAAPAAGPTAPVAALNAGLAKTEAAAAQPMPQRYAALAPVIDASYDLPGILQTIVGLKWSGLPAAQKARLLVVFRAYTIASYLGNFNSNAGDRFDVKPATQPAGSDTRVVTQIVPKSGEPTEIDYVVRQTPAGFRIVDVLPEGTISQVAVQRSDFRSQIAAGDASKLITSLEQKVAQLTGGAVKP